MKLKELLPTTFFIAFIGFGLWIVYGIFFPTRHYRQGQLIAKIQIVAKETPYFHFTGLDDPSYYVIKSQNYTNYFHISDEVLELVQDNKSISKAITEIENGDTLFISLDSASVLALNNTTKSIDII